MCHHHVGKICQQVLFASRIFRFVRELTFSPMRGFVAMRSCAILSREAFQLTTPKLPATWVILPIMLALSDNSYFRLQEQRLRSG
mmetsp:Transcript_29444/g.73606  ORF Transcript_29444/g.73606 Transcript_29444/m.73606 type:complete len:85 (+) Transcript_29444:342-596(+)